MVNTTTLRVPLNTASDVNERIRHETEKSIAFYTVHPEWIDQRLVELDKEWDIERIIETHAPTASLVGLFLSITVSRKWLFITLLAQSMLLLHALQGWYPLLPLLRRLGVRSEREIAIERYALRTVRGDFANIRQEQPDEALKATW